MPSSRLRAPLVVALWASLLPWCGAQTNQGAQAQDTQVPGGAPPPAPCIDGACLNAKNQLECTWIEECTSATETCAVCYTTLTDTAAKVGLVRFNDTHLYRFALCDGQTPFKVHLTTNLGMRTCHSGTSPTWP
jgi:hypothetical protein